jgi:hypothetical protein
MKNDWNTLEGKRAIFQAVMKYLHEHPEEKPRCLDYAYARQIVREQGNAEIPPDAKVLFVQTGDLGKEVGSSLVIELPPDNFDPSADDVFQYAACTYPLW